MSSAPLDCSTCTARPSIPSTRDATSRVAWGRKHFETEVGHDRFRDHFAVHEVEAWLLAAPDRLPAAVAKALPGRKDQPEQINSDDPPGMLLARLYREKLREGYKKTLHGRNLFRAGDPDVVYAKCPSFQAMLDDMLDLARQAGL